jgi:GNAT superfamily N-acetyltransferase
MGEAYTRQATWYKWVKTAEPPSARTYFPKPINRKVIAIRAFVTFSLKRKVSRGLTSAELAVAVELNAAEWVRLLGRLPWVEWHDDGDVEWVFAGESWPRNSVGLARFAPKAAHKRVRQILTYHIERGVACNWIMGPTAQPSTLAQDLRAHGFRCILNCTGMACDLGRIKSVSVPAKTAIALTDSAVALNPLTTERRRLRQQGKTMMAQFSPKQVWHFAAYLDGRAVGETTLCTGAGVAGLFDVEVIEEFRGRGVGAALVHAAVLHAKSLGISAAVLAATGLGFGVYERVGFETVGKLSFWRYGKTKGRRQAASAPIG